MKYLNTENEYFLTIDAGSSGVKAGIGTTSGSLLTVVKTDWSYYSPDGLELYGAEFDPAEFWNKIVITVNEVIKKSNIESSKISCIAVTSQRHGSVFLDQDGNEIYTGPNRDARGLEVEIEDYIDPAELYKITGLNPPFLFVPARYLWFKENEEEKFSLISKILTISGWIIYKLTKEFIIDSTLASATQLMDLESLDWSEKILDILKLKNNKLPELVPIGKIIGQLTEKASSELGLRKDIIVTLSGADTQSAIIGTGANTPGDVIVVAGSTMPILQLTNKPIVDSERMVWSGCFFEENKWLLEANTGPAGVVKDWFVNTFMQKVTEPGENGHSQMDKIASDQKPGSNDILMDLGIEIFDLNKMTDISLSSITFPSVIYSMDSAPDINGFCRAMFENLAFVIRGNIERLEKTSQLPAKNIFIVGGMSKSPVLRKILANVLNNKVHFFHTEGTIIGGFFACMLAKKYVNSYTEFSHSLKNQIQTINPDENDVQIYNQYYRKWLENYKQKQKNIEEFN